VELLETFVNTRLDLAAKDYLGTKFFFWHFERITLGADARISSSDAPGG
jgi:hypothetical protein